PDLLERARQADRRPRIPADISDDGRVRSADLAASLPRGVSPRLSDGEALRIRNLVDIRLAIRDQRGHGANRLRWLVRSIPAPEGDLPPYGRDGAIFRWPPRPRLGPARRPHFRRRSQRRAETTAKTAARLLQVVLRRHGSVRCLRRHDLRLEVL